MTKWILSKLCAYCFGLLLTLIAQVAMAGESPFVYIDIPAQPLTQGIIEFALQTDVTVVAQEECLKGLAVTPLTGLYRVENALARIIGDAPVTFSYIPDRNTYLLFPTPQKNENLQAEIKEHDLIPLEELLVLGNNFPMRYQNLINSLDRNGVSLYDSSRFHNMASKELIDDLEPQSLSTLLEYSSGVTTASGFGGTAEDFYIRGYRRNNLYLDGFRLSDRTAMRIAPPTINKTEVLKGPSMLFYGQSGAGGVVNVVRSVPSGEDTTKASVTSGSENYSEVFLDVNKASLLDLNIPFRVIGTHENTGAGDLYNSQTRTDILATLAFEPNEKFAASTSYQWQGYEHKDSTARYALTNSGAYLPFSDKQLFTDDDTAFKSSVGLLSGSFHYFSSSDWRVSGNYLWQEEKRFGLRMDEEFALNQDVLLGRDQSTKRTQLNFLANRVVAPVLEENCGFNKQCSVIPEVISLTDQKEYETDVSMNVLLAGSFQYFGAEQRLVLGMDLYHQDLYELFELNSRRLVEGIGWVVDGELEDVQLATIISSLDNMENESMRQLKEYRVLRDDFGIYTQLHTQWNAQWMTSVGWRISRFIGEQWNITKQESGLIGNVSDISPQFGIVYQPTDDLSLFSNYSESIAVRYLIDDMEAFAQEPEVAEQWEVGLKWLGAGGALSFSAALFEIEKTSVYQLVVEGGQRTLEGPFEHNVKGFESDLNYDISRNWQLISHLTLLDSKVQSKEGEYTPPYVADVSWSLFNHWQMTGGWELTAGAIKLSDRSIGSDELVRLDGYVSVDGSVSNTLRLDKFDLEFKLIVKNLLEENHIRTAYTGGYPVSDHGRSIFLKLAASI